MSPRDRRESPVRRVNPSGKVVWVARYTDEDGRRRSAGTYSMKRVAQDAIDRAYERPATSDTLGAYAKTWTTRHPRSARTNATNDHRLSRVLGVRVDGPRLEAWPLRDLRRRHAVELVNHLLVHQGRATTGAVNILRVLSALFEDAITDELADVNPFKGVKVRANDPRAQKRPRAPLVWSFEEMHEFAAAAGPYEPMVRAIGDCGFRLGEAIGIERRDFDGDVFRIRGSAHNGVFVEGDQPTKRHVRVVPCPPATAQFVRAMPPRIDTPLLFASPAGKLWQERNFYRDVWHPTRERVKGMEAARPHDFRHSWETHLHAAGIDPADLAAMAGHSLAAMQGRYIHPLHRSYDAVRDVIG